MDSSSQSSDFVVGNCIGCRGLVRVPSNTMANVSVRCPRCGEMYLLSAILDHDIPALEVVDEPMVDGPPRDGSADIGTGSKYQPVTEQENGRFVVPSYLAKAAERKTRRKSGSQESESNPVVQDTEASSLREKSRERRTRPERNRKPRASVKRSPFLEFMMVVLGGMMSLPVAQLMVWWILGSDPLGFAPEVSKVVPFVVPSDLREAEPAETDSVTKSTLDQ